jgi:transposase
MARRKPWEVSDELWAVIEPLLPKHERRFRYPGRKRIDDRKTLQGVLFVLYTGVQWEFLPQELGFGSGPTCWRRLAEWQEAGVWEELQRVLLDRCGRRTASTSPAPPSTPRTCRPSGGEAAQKSVRARLAAHGRARNTTS